MNLDPSKEREALPSLLLLLGTILIAWVLANLIGTGLMMLIGGLSFTDLALLNEKILNAENGWWAMIAAQGATSLISFVLSGLFYWYVVEKKTWADLSFRSTPPAAIIVLVFITQLAFAPFNGWVQELNQNMTFPPFMRGIEEFMKNMEDQLAELTTFITTFDSNAKFIAAILIIGVLAGVGEELIFRGLIQRKLMLTFKNHHAAIWVAAVIFSAIHIQFYGFFPRVLLGAMFGYFYYWSGNIWVPIAAHIFNNSFAVVMVHLVHLKKVSPDIEKLDKLPLSLVGASLALFLLLAFQIKKQMERGAN